MTTLNTLRLFVTPEHDCSYIDRVQARTLFVDPQVELSRAAYTDLTQRGFRRSGVQIYRPHCDYCSACISTRIPVQRFTLSKGQRRIFNRNQDLLVETTTPRFDDEIYALYESYINQRHQDGDMYPPSPEQFKGFLISTQQVTQFHLFRSQEGELLAVAVTDQLDDGLSAVYTFFDPNQAKRSLGTYAVLWQANHLQQHNKPYLYLGYWVKSCRKMTYKSQFKPTELLLDDNWVEANRDITS